jgi:two-component system nitrogen regulation response regulator NtrX
MKILIVDDEKAIRKALRLILEYEEYTVLEAATGQEMFNILSDESEIDLVFLDLKLPDVDGIKLLEKLKTQSFSGEIVIITGHGDTEIAVKTIKLGAYDYLEKPLDQGKIRIILKNIGEKIWLQTENIKLKTEIERNIKFIGNSPQIREILSVVKRVAPTQANVFINGENGTGKELIARLIHSNSTKSNQPFIELNCAALPEELIESELFGYVKGAFTNAVKDKMGKVELANDGTLFLDEIGDMSLRTQAKVLRLIQFGEFEPLGSVKKQIVNIRFIAATNKNTKENIKKGTFREDLFYRLNVVPINIPPLRERKDDIKLLISFYNKLFAKINKIKEKEFAPDVIKALLNYRWPGNVRELKNIIERLIIMTDSNKITTKDINSFCKFDIGEPEELNFDLSFKEFKNNMERTYILKKLNKNNWNITNTAKQLGLQRVSLYKKLEQLNIKIER